MRQDPDTPHKNERRAIAVKVFLDGKWLEEDEARAPVYEPGFVYGQGLFETMCASNKKIFRLDSHINRLMQSSGVIKINLTYSKQQLRDIVNQTLGINNYSSAYVRLTVWQGKSEVHICVIVGQYEPYSQEKYSSGFRAILSNIRQNETSVLANVKSSSRLHLLLAEYEAKESNADEAVLLNTKGKIAEGTRTNIFLVKDKTLFTPDRESGCLLGITRDTILDIAAREKMKAHEKEISPHELFSADEAFLTNSLIGIMPLSLLDDKKIGSGRMDRITGVFFKKYQELLNI